VHVSACIQDHAINQPRHARANCAHRKDYECATYTMYVVITSYPIKNFLYKNEYKYI